MPLNNQLEGAEMKRLISITFAFMYLILPFGFIKASAMANQTVTIEGVEYAISDEIPYVVVVPESITVGDADSVYIAGEVNGTVTLSVPSSTILTQEGKNENKISCSVQMGTGNKLVLSKSTALQTVRDDIRVDFDGEAPLTGNWSGNITYSVYANIAKDVTGYLNFTLSDDGTYYIISSVKDTAILSYCNNNLVLPSTYNGKPVKEIGEKLFYAGVNGSMADIAKQKGSIKVTIPSSVTTIGKYAFGYFGGSGTQFIIEGNNLKTIGDNAFNRSYLYSINIPDSVTSIGSDAFAYCTYLAQVNIPAYLQILGGWAFNNCTALSGTIVLPETLTNMEQSAFASCSKITAVEWNCKLAAIPYAAFKGCTKLNSFSMSTSAKSVLTEIKGYAFNKCSALTSFEFPPTVTTIANYAFYASGLKSATYPKTAKTESKSFPSGCTLNPI